MVVSQACFCLLLWSQKPIVRKKYFEWKNSHVIIVNVQCQDGMFDRESNSNEWANGYYPDGFKSNYDYVFLFFPQLRSTQKCITAVSSLSHTLHHYVSWSWRISRYVTSYGVNRCVLLHFMLQYISFYNAMIKQWTALSLAVLKCVIYTYF